MPLYDYRCHRCGEVFEVRQKFADPVLTVHESCGGELERMISAPALQFKGSGWYVTDYAKNGKSPSATAANTKSETKSESTSESKTGNKSESKPENTASKPAPASTSSDA
jgi:putative FmdB family regulatory protein